MQKLKALHNMNVGSQNFLQFVERTTDAFMTGGDDSAVDDVRHTLLDVRQQYDSVHSEAERKEAQLKQLREAIRSADNSHNQKSDEEHRLKDSKEHIERQYHETHHLIQETETNRKVYEHMLARMQKEQAILKEKMFKMEGHLSRKTQELSAKGSEQERRMKQKVQSQRNFDAFDNDAETEREACREAQSAMHRELKRRQYANCRRADFEGWRHEVALEAANEAFNTSAGRLRKLYAIEKLAGNCLQKITFDQVERSEKTENGFQKIREVTGLKDVMDIVHKFLNREVEHNQLQLSVKDAEVRLEKLCQDYDEQKFKTEGITFDPSANGRSGEIYKEVEGHEQILNDALKEHEACRIRMQKTTLQVEHLKRWTQRLGAALGAFEDPVQVEMPGHFPVFFDRLQHAVQKFVEHVGNQISDGKVQRQKMSKMLNNEMQEQERRFKSKEFQQFNCRVPAVVGDSNELVIDDDPDASFANDREKCKTDSHGKIDAEQRRLDQMKRKGQKGP